MTDTAHKKSAANLVVLGRYVHENWVGPVKADYSQPSSVAVGTGICGTSITSSSCGNCKLVANPHFVFADAQLKSYGVVDITPGQIKTTLRVVSDGAPRCEH